MLQVSFASFGLCLLSAEHLLCISATLGCQGQAQCTFYLWGTSLTEYSLPEVMQMYPMPPRVQPPW